MIAGASGTRFHGIYTVRRVTRLHAESAVGTLRLFVMTAQTLTRLLGRQATGASRRRRESSRWEVAELWTPQN